MIDPAGHNALRRHAKRMLNETDFETVDAVCALLPGELHLWHWQAGPAASVREVPALARMELGELLRAYAGTGTPPPLQRGVHGKPFVPESGYPHFNLSHSGRCAVLAFSFDQEIGVDVEVHGRRHSPLELAERFFAAEESAALAALDATEQGPAFMRLWTCKEAVLKALGHGLSFGLERIRFSLEDGGRTTALHSIAEEAGKTEDWHLLRFEPAPAHSGALAWRGAPLRVRAFRRRTRLRDCCPN